MLSRGLHTPKGRGARPRGWLRSDPAWAQRKSAVGVGDFANPATSLQGFVRGSLNLRRRTEMGARRRGCISAILRLQRDRPSRAHCRVPRAAHSFFAFFAAEDACSGLHRCQKSGKADQDRKRNRRPHERTSRFGFRWKKNSVLNKHFLIFVPENLSHCRLSSAIGRHFFKFIKPTETTPVDPARVSAGFLVIWRAFPEAEGGPNRPTSGFVLPRTGPVEASPAVQSWSRARAAAGSAKRACVGISFEVCSSPTLRRRA